MESKEHKPKFSIATRAQAMTLRHCGYSFKNIELQTGISERQLQHIIRTAKKHGYDSEKSFRLEDEHFPDGHKTGRPRKFTEEQAEALIAAAQPGEDGTKKTNAVLAKEFGVSERTVRRRRIQQQQENDTKAVKPKRVSKQKAKQQQEPQPQLQHQQEQNGIPEPTAPQAQMHMGIAQQQERHHQNFDSQLQSAATPCATDGGEEHNFEARLMEQLQHETHRQQPAELGMYTYPPPSYHTPGPLGPHSHSHSHSLSPGHPAQ